MRICVYCASSAQAPVCYRDAAFELGRLLAVAGHTIVFGGGGIGSMKHLADGAHSVGGEVVGVMPHFMKTREWAHPDVRTFLWTLDMAERKAKMLENTQAVIALPGGCGTFEELLEVLSLKRLGMYINPVVIVNQQGFYDALITQIERSVQEGFMDVRHLGMFSVVAGVDKALAAIEQARLWSHDAWRFAAQR